MGHVELELSESDGCPRCALLRPILRSISERLKVPLIRRSVDVSYSVFGADPVNQLFRDMRVLGIAPELVQQARRDRGVVLALNRGRRIVHTPVITIRAYLRGRGPVQLHIWGFPAHIGEDNREEVENFAANLEALIVELMKG